VQDDIVKDDDNWNAPSWKRHHGDRRTPTIRAPVRTPRRPVVTESRGVNDPAFERARCPRSDLGVVHATAPSSVTGEIDVAICAVIRDVFCSEIRPESRVSGGSNFESCVE
jgi:hypothetical protein